MNSKLVGLLLVCFISAPLAHAIDVAISADIRLGKVLPPPPPEIVIVEDTLPKGPPPWAPAHGFRRNRDYYYYPDSNVYFRPTDRTWFYLEGGNWRIGAELPTRINLNLERSVSLTMETDQPFQHHEQVTRYYPKDFFTQKAKIKGPKHERSSKPDSKPGRDADGRQDHGGGKGKGKGRDR